MAAPVTLLETPLHDLHQSLGARMVDFGGWHMPVQYTSIIEEHHAVRRQVGLFDVSHMGEIEIRGPQAFDLVNFVATTAVSKMKPGQARYSGLLYPHGGFVDDILIYKISEQEFFLCVNAANQRKDFHHIHDLNEWDCEVDFASDRYAQLAIQGPSAAPTLQKLTDLDLSTIRYYHFTGGEVDGVPARIARTGYTGEDCFEIFFTPEEAPRLWNRILEAGGEFGIRPCGLGARNTLRLEAGMALYGHEISASITPLEAGLGRNVDMNKDFLGRDALQRQLERGVHRKLAGFEMTGRGIARDGYEIMVNGLPSGWVTSGGPSPTLNKNIGLCYLPASHAETGRSIEVLVRGQTVPAVTVPFPFYKRAK